MDLPIVKMLRKRARAARDERTATAIADAQCFDSSADLIEKLAEALEPIAAHADLLDELDTDDTILCGFDGKFITAGHVRAARAALALAKEPPK